MRREVTLFSLLNTTILSYLQSVNLRCIEFYRF